MKSLIAICVCALLAACDAVETEMPDAQVIDAGAPDAPEACNPFHEGCAGCGERGRSCCYRAAPAPTMYCLGDDVVCDPVAVNCVDLGRP